MFNARFDAFLDGWKQIAVNPSFPLTRYHARLALAAMQAEPKPQRRPVVFVGGYRDPGLGPAFASARLRGLTGWTDVYAINTRANGDMDAAREALIDAVAAVVPGDAEGRTPVVDVIGLSMGGLTARHAAAPLPGRRALRVGRLFTCGSPHAGARMARFRGPDAKVPAMRSGSAFLTDLARYDAGAPYELICYGRLGDKLVGVENTAPPGRVPWWLATPAFGLPHVGTAGDPRVVADMLRRLRGEAPFTVGPPAPLP